MYTRTRKAIYIPLTNKTYRPQHISEGDVLRTIVDDAAEWGRYKHRSIASRNLRNQLDYAFIEGHSLLVRGVCIFSVSLLEAIHFFLYTDLAAVIVTDFPSRIYFMSIFIFHIFLIYEGELLKRNVFGI